MNVGDRVAFSVQFLRSIDSEHSHLAVMRGTITRLTSLGSTQLADIAWDGCDPSRANVANLAIVGANRKFCWVD